MVSLKTELKHKWGRKACLPIVGEIKITEEGIIEVESEEIAQQIEALEIGFNIVEVVETTSTTTEAPVTTTTTTVEETTTTTTAEPLKEKTEEDELNPEGENELHEEIQEDAGLISQHEKEIFFASLEEKTVAELKELAKDFPGAEWRNLIKKDLITYLKEKLA